jgi:molecular chaperone HtpG
MDHLSFFNEKRLVAAEKAEIQVDQPEGKQHALSEDDARLLANFIKEGLGERVGEVRVSKRLVGSPAVVVDKDTHMTTSMRRVLKMMQQREGGAPTLESKPDLEINPDHAMMVRLNTMRATDGSLATQVAEQIFDNALVAAGLLEDPRIMLGRLNSLLEKLLEKQG